ncbi:MAG TPA: alpha/beta fold hydrolase [Longimicrobium sp.]|nr:alpha/beta fold hydrolase [Longimicrobium sp.]
MSGLRSRGLAAGISLLLIGGVAQPAAAQRTAADSAQRFVGDWQGPLRVSGIALRLGFTFTRDSAGGLAGTLTSIDQGGVKLPITVSVRGDSIRVESAPARASFTGRLVAADSIDGAWSQGGASFPLGLKRVAQVSVARRPQEPKPPFPYREEEVSFASAAGVRLAGTLTLPQGTGPFPAVVLVSGSGPQDRDEEILGHRPFAVLADHLTRQGIAVLRYDDRGVAKSTGSFVDATSGDFADDALAAVRYLGTRREVAPRKIGIAGHSEGGMIAPMVAVRAPEVAFLVLLAGTGLPGDSILKMQGRLIARSAGTPAEVIELSGRTRSRMFAAIAEGGDTAAVRARLRRIGGEMLAQLTDEQRRAAQLTPATMEANIGQLSTPWFRYFLAYDPRPTLRRVRVPVLALNGSLDLQVPPKENLAAIAAALREGGNRDVRTIELPGLNHLFQTTTTGAPTEYAQIEETMSPAVLNAVSTWILERFGPGR